MSNIKYTTDGRKVVVIGSLNSQEKIVQEIFVVGGNEIPSGENFIVKSLHDSPAISWKEKNMIDLNASYEKKLKATTNRINELESKYQIQSTLFSQKIEYIGKALKNADENSFNFLVDYICGHITHIVIEQYHSAEVVSMSEFNHLYEGKLRLLSFFGKDDGTFSYAVGEYYDYSGGNKKIHPYKSYEDAVLKASEIILKHDLEDSSIKTLNKLNIQIPEEKLKKYKEDKTRTIDKDIQSFEEKIRDLNKQKDSL